MNLVIITLIHAIRCHKVIVSSWSRWLRSLLLEGADEVLSLDIFDPTALGAVLDYMYGTALTITVEVCRRESEGMSRDDDQ